MNMVNNMSRGTMLQHNHLKWVEVLNQIVQTGDQLTYHEDTKVNEKVNNFIPEFHPKYFSQQWNYKDFFLSVSS